MRLPIVFVALYACVALGVLPAAGASCGDLAKLTLPTTTINSAEAVPAGPYTPPGSPTIGDAPAFCRVAGVIQPVDDSNIQFEVWMPGSGWNGKFQGVGNGGFGGSINYGGLADAVRHGYAGASTDTGHHANATDATWALGASGEDRRFRISRHPRDRRQSQGIIRALSMATAPQPFLFQLLLERRPPGSHGSPALPGRLRRHHRRRARQLLDASADHRGRGLRRPCSPIPPATFRPAKLPAIEAATLEACDAHGRREGRRHRQSAAMPLRSLQAPVQGTGVRYVPHRAAGGGLAEASTTVLEIPRASRSSPAIHRAAKPATADGRCGSPARHRPRA